MSNQDNFLLRYFTTYKGLYFAGSPKKNRLTRGRKAKRKASSTTEEEENQEEENKTIEQNKTTVLTSNRTTQSCDNKTSGETEVGQTDKNGNKTVPSRTVSSRTASDRTLSDKTTDDDHDRTMDEGNEPGTSAGKAPGDTADLDKTTDNVEMVEDRHKPEEEVSYLFSFFFFWGGHILEKCLIFPLIFSPPVPMHGGLLCVALRLSVCLTRKKSH